MTVPDFQQISEIELLAAGFRSAKPLASKLVAAFRLCSELLSAQNHYDFGMRALKTVLRLAIAQRLRPIEDDETNEYDIVAKAFNDVNFSKLINDDVPIFQVTS